MAIQTSIWQSVVPALLVAGLVAAPVGLDLQQDLWVAASEAYAGGSNRDSLGEGGPGDDRAARSDAREGRSRPAGRNFSERGISGGVGRAPIREYTLAVARERYNRALGVTAHVSVEASAKPGQGLVTNEAAVVVSTKGR